MPPRPPKSRRTFAMVDPAWLQAPLAGSELRVLISLSLHADWTKLGNGRCFPKRETIARECRLQVSQVSDALPKLEKLGLIHVARLGRQNIYFVRPIGAAFEMPPSNVEPFFAYLAENGHVFDVGEDGELIQIHGDLANINPIYKTLATEYELGLPTERLRKAVLARMPATTAVA